MEACCGAHYWGRRFRDLGLEVRLIHAKFVRPFVKSAKNDARDAEAIGEAALRPHMRFVPLKSREQLDIQALHRVRDQLVRWRTRLINQTRGLLAEQGIVLPQGRWRFRKETGQVLDDPAGELTTLALELFRGLLDQLRELEGRIATLGRRIVQLCRASEVCRRLTALPGSVRSSPQPWSPASAMPTSSAAAATSRPGSDWCPGSIRAAAGRSSWGSAPAVTTTCASS
jgi:transposase